MKYFMFFICVFFLFSCGENNFTLEEKIEKNISLTDEEKVKYLKEATEYNLDKSNHQSF